MKLHPNWKGILRKAWSIKLIILAGFFSGAEFLLPFLDFLPIHRGVLGFIGFVIANGAVVTRLLVQKDLEKHDG